MSKRNYDSEFCGSLPLHHINQIQPYGYLLVLSRDNLEIIQASENVSDLFGKDVAEVIGLSLNDFIGKTESEVIRDKFLKPVEGKIPVNLTLNANNSNIEYIALIHAKPEYLIVEIEKLSVKSSFTELYQSIKFIMSEINAADTITDICQRSVSSLKNLAGFDRVLMYQFDADWNGTVIAEDKEGNMEPYVGLKFPASDIPKQARALYLKNPFRLIPNREDKPVRIYPIINPLTNSFIDLTDCNLRSVAGVHLEYMQNMGIKASMSIRIICNGVLWGLISCHHKEPKYLSYEMCSVFELLSELISSKITSVLYQQQFQYKTSLWDKKRSVLEGIYSSNNFFTDLVNKDEELLALFESTGVAVVYNGKVHLHGVTPDIEEIKHLVFWLQHKNLTEVYAETNLSAAFELASGYVANASGLLTIPMGNKNEDFLLFFRSEVQTTVSWGGDPGKAISFEADGKKYHPRNSFSIWQETVKETSLPWSGELIEVAESIRTFIFEYSTKYIYS